MNVDLTTMAERLEAQEAGQQQTRAQAVEDLARRLAWGPAADKKTAAEVERLCSSAEEVRALERRVAGLRRLRELQPLAARALELRAAACEMVVQHAQAVAEHREHGLAAGRRLLSDPTLVAEEVVRLRRLALWPDPRPIRRAEEEAAQAEHALAQVLEFVPAAVAQALRDAEATLRTVEAEPARLRREIADLPDREASLRAELARAERVVFRRKDDPRAWTPSVREPEEIKADVDSLPSVHALEAELGAVPKLIELARQKHAAAFKAVVTWGRA